MGNKNVASGVDSEDQLDPELIAVMGKMWEIWTESRHRPCSLAKLSKRVGCYMSTLRRHLTVLEDAGVVTVSIREDGTGVATLTEAGADLCRIAFSELPSDADPEHQSLH